MTRLRIGLWVAVVSLAASIGACTPTGANLDAVESDDLASELRELADAIGDSRIVLLGENGHGVGSVTEWKVELVEWLYRELGFEVIVFESGYFECGHVWRRIEELQAADALFQCLRYPFQHAEILPLFELIRANANELTPLEMAGMDIQAQGFDSDLRPETTYDILQELDPDLAERVAALDTALYLVADHGGLDDDAFAWAHLHRDSALALYREAGNLTNGRDRWIFRMSEGWVERLAVRGEAEATGEQQRPARYFELRDEWMAKSISALADSVTGSRKVVVWLHNDHGRYGPVGADGSRPRSAGAFLREQYGEGVFSIGVFVGAGEVADNGRTVHQVEAFEPGGVESFMSRIGGEASYLVLRGASDTEVASWAHADQAYLRSGTETRTLVPADEFDALFFVPTARVPNYEIR